MAELLELIVTMACLPSIIYISLFNMYGLEIPYGDIKLGLGKGLLPGDIMP